MATMMIHKSNGHEGRTAFMTSTDNNGQKRIRETGENKGGQFSLFHSGPFWVFIQGEYLILATKRQDDYHKRKGPKLNPVCFSNFESH